MLSPHVPMNRQANTDQQYGFGIILAPLSIYDSASHAGAIPENISPPYVSLLAARPAQQNPIGFAAFTRAMWDSGSLNAIYGAYAAATAFSDAKGWLARLRKRPQPEELLKWVSNGEMSPDLAKTLDPQTSSDLAAAITGNPTLTIQGEQVQGTSVTLGLLVHGSRGSSIMSIQFGPHGRLESLRCQPEPAQ